MSFLHCGRFRLSLDRTLVMGIINVTPDSFSDGGLNASPPLAVDFAERPVADGADILDVGGESTRPGAQPVGLQEELDRVIPVLEKLRGCPVPVSVDTYKAGVMRAAIAAGASMVNDVSALRAPGALEAVAASEAAVCLMHMQGEPRTMQDNPRRFRQRMPDTGYERFCGENAFWIDDYALFSVLSAHHTDITWERWPPTARSRSSVEIRRLRRDFHDRIENLKIEQYLFYCQWLKLRSYCRKKCIHLFGDLPIYVPFHSADVWAHRSSSSWTATTVLWPFPVFPRTTSAPTASFGATRFTTGRATSGRALTGGSAALHTRISA